MVSRWPWAALLILGLVASLARGESPPNSAAALANSMRTLLLSALPTPLYEDSPNWGHTKHVAVGIKWKGKGLKVHPEAQYADRNDGIWRTVRISAENLPNALVFEVRDVRQEGTDKTLFTVFLAFDASVDFTQQNWDEGLKLYDGSVRATAKVKLTLSCEMTTRTELTGGFVPDVVLRVRVTKANLEYDHLVIKHVAGLGGDAAKVLGGLVTSTIKQLHPSLERHLLAKANAAIEKAADTKEVRISLLGLVGKK